MSKDLVYAAISKLSRKKIDETNLHQSLGSLGLNSSFGLTALRSLLEAQFNRKLPVFDLNTDVATLINLSQSSEESNADIQVASLEKKAYVNSEKNINNLSNSISSFPRIGLGMDIQQINVFEMVSDFREDPFYKAHFNDSEIATAALKIDPLIHFAGIFSAKEAAKKSHDDLIDLRMTDFIVTHSSSGKPLLSLRVTNVYAAKFKFLISITHSSEYAAATCLTFWEH